MDELVEERVHSLMRVLADSDPRTSASDDRSPCRERTEKLRVCQFAVTLGSPRDAEDEPPRDRSAQGGSRPDRRDRGTGKGIRGPSRHCGGAAASDPASVRRTGPAPDHLPSAWVGPVSSARSECPLGDIPLTESAGGAVLLAEGLKKVLTTAAAGTDDLGAHGGTEERANHPMTCESSPCHRT